MPALEPDTADPRFRDPCFRQLLRRLAEDAIAGKEAWGWPEAWFHWQETGSRVGLDAVAQVDRARTPPERASLDTSHSSA